MDDPLFTTWVGDISLDATLVLLDIVRCPAAGVDVFACTWFDFVMAPRGFCEPIISALGILPKKIPHLCGRHDEEDRGDFPRALLASKAGINSAEMNPIDSPPPMTHIRRRNFRGSWPPRIRTVRTWC